MEQWKQFSLHPPGCRNKMFAGQVLHGFLPSFLLANPTIERWHCLFEPNALVRVRAPAVEAVLVSAEALAPRWGLEFVRGDVSSDWNGELQWPGEDYRGEDHIYGEALWLANQKFMQATSELAIELVKLPHGEQPAMYRKFVHLLFNALGMNHLEEAAFAQFWSDEAIARFRQYGRS
jgi:hypothetical protein